MFSFFILFYLFYAYTIEEHTTEFIDNRSFGCELCDYIYISKKEIKRRSRSRRNKIYTVYNKICNAIYHFLFYLVTNAYRFPLGNIFIYYSGKCDNNKILFSCVHLINIKSVLHQIS